MTAGTSGALPGVTGAVRYRSDQLETFPRGFAL